MIRVQAEDFDVGAEIAALSADSPGAGGLCVFVGLVRDLNDGAPVAAMTLEHYPGMTERELARLEEDARTRWPLAGVRIVHRYGRLLAGERIVLVAVSSAHRHAAFEACRFLIDRLKTVAPFWKAEETPAGRRWVDARAADDAAADRWGPCSGRPK